MHKAFSNISIEVNPHLYVKRPESSALGKRIIAGSIELLESIGFDQFNFKLLGKHIKSPEASMYRYFENKHKLLLYLTAWYWAWMEWELIFKLANVESAEERLDRAISLLVGPMQLNAAYEHIDEIKLHRIVIAESAKAYLTKTVDSENQEGCFAGYKQLVGRIADIVTEIAPDYKYPHMLVSTLIEGAHHQRFFAEHLPRLTDVVPGEDAITSFSKLTLRNAIQAPQ